MKYQSALEDYTERFREKEIEEVQNLHIQKINYRISAALGIGRSTIRRILNEDIVEVKIQSVVEKLTEKSDLKKEKVKNFDSFDLDELKARVYSLYRKRQCVSISKLKQLYEDEGRKVSVSSLRRYIKKIRFRYRRAGGKRFFKESDDIIATRHDYLRKIKKYREEGWEIVYTDETWINANHACTAEWTHNHDHPMCKLMPDCSHCGRHIPTGKGSRLIVLDAGSSATGFIPDVGLIFRSKTNSADYHDEMYGHIFGVVKETVIPALQNPSVIVMDNAPYHNIRTKESIYPTSSNNKSEIIRWLSERNVPLNGDEIKAELLQKVKLNKPNIRYKTDEIAEENGHLVLRLPETTRSSL